MTTLLQKIKAANAVIEAQKRLLDYCYKVDKTEYTDRQLLKFEKFETDLITAATQYESYNPDELFNAELLLNQFNQNGYDTRA